MCEFPRANRKPLESNIAGMCMAQSIPPELEKAIQLLEAEAANFAYTFIKDSKVRFNYMKQSKASSESIKAAYRAGKVSAAEGASRANNLRNVILDTSRMRSTALGKAVAEKMKKNGRTLEELLEYYAKKKFSQPFSKLSGTQQNKVYLEVIEAAGRSRPTANAAALKMSKVGKGFVVLTIGIAAYNIYTAEDKVKATVKEGATIGGGVAGGALGGAAAGLICGPGAPICSGVGIFVGGALGALGVDYAFDFF